MSVTTPIWSLLALAASTALSTLYGSHTKDGINLTITLQKSRQQHLA